MANKPHKHAELIKAWADGAEIQFFNPTYEGNGWRSTISPTWNDNYQYRIKPREFPKTSLSGVRLGEVYTQAYMADSTKPYGGFEAVANEAIKQYILDSEAAAA